MDVYQITVFTYFVALFSKVSSLKCLQCSTMITEDNEDCFDGTLQALDCDNKNETYCVKYEGIIDDVTFVIRGCDNKDMSSVCMDKILEGELVHRCYHSCQSDGCNHGNSLYLDTTMFSLTLVSCSLAILDFLAKQ